MSADRKGYFRFRAFSTAALQCWGPPEPKSKSALELHQLALHPRAPAGQRDGSMASMMASLIFFTWTLAWAHDRSGYRRTRLAPCLREASQCRLTGSVSGRL